MMNLAELMKREQPEASRLNVYWFLRCAKGLTDALKFIHSFSIPDNSLDPGSDDTHRKVYTFHHDLKPENILCYLGQIRSDGCVLKIADFGASVIEFLGSNGKSRSHSDPSGTLTYQGPERKRSRPSDLWSLGCVLLEFALWFATPNFTRENFASDRIAANPREEGGKVESDLFWCWKEGQKYEQLSDAVEAQLKGLEGLEFPFPELAMVVRKMLRRRPEDRIKAPDLDFDIEQLLTSHGLPHEKRPETNISQIDARSLQSHTPPDETPVDSRGVSRNRREALVAGFLNGGPSRPSTGDQSRRFTLR